MTQKLRWGILGTGMISHRLAEGLAGSETGQLFAVGSRSQRSADEWAKKYQCPKAYGSYAALLADPQVDAVYVALLNHLHCEWVVRAAEAGKHILCEKPLALNSAELMVMLEACRAHRVFFLEAFMYRCHPGTASWLKLIRGGAIGEVRAIDAEFGFDLQGGTTHTRMINEYGGGAILDVGCYCLSASRAIAGAALGKDFVEPIDLSGVGHVGTTGVDEWAAGTLRFPGDIVASVSTGIQLQLGNQVRVWGTKGHLVVPSPWHADGRALLYEHGKPDPRDVGCLSPKPLYAHEVDVLGRCVAAGKPEAESPAMTWADSRGQQAALDRWRKAVGVAYAGEKPEQLTRTLAGRPLEFGRSGKISSGHVPGLGKPVSRVVLGSMALRFDDLPYTCAMLDDYFERGGNAADTAFVYGANVEKALGKWINLRGVREQFVVLAKGAHTAGTARPFHDPGCDPETLRRQLHLSLERMQLNYVDIYCLHRDNPLIPVGEFVDVLNELVAAGYIRVFGGSNWTVDRIEAANAYAAKHGKQGFSVLSNHFSLAVWNEPMWAHCLASTDPASKAWLERSRFPLFAWSSQAGGLFTGRFKPGDRSNAEAVRVWYNDNNFKRLARAEELARKKRCTPVQIALAYVLCQPFEVYALIGPRTIEETRTSLAALDVTLTADDLAWLNLEH